MTASAALLTVALGAVGLPSNVEGSIAGGKPGTDESSTRKNERLRDAWILSFEGVTRVPIDAGAQVGFETPFGLRVFGAYGWVPYINMLTGIVVDASDRNVVTVFLDRGNASGNSTRFVLGWRPFRRLGLTIDGTYARLHLDAHLAVPPISFPGLEFPGGSYAGRTSVGLWGVELGYQGEIERRLVLGAAAGITGATDSHTSITPSGAAPDDPALPAAAARVDHAFRTHVIPTLTLRLGFDAI